jgi:hypothetical protein
MTPESTPLSGSYILVRAIGAAPGDVCFDFHDPPTGTARVVVGLLSFDSTTARLQEVRVTGFGCNGSAVGDTVRVDVRREYRASGSSFVIQRPVSGGVVEDSGSVIGTTVVIRRGIFEYVYERVSQADNAFFARTGDLTGWMVGTATFASGADRWTLSLAPTHGIRNQRIYLFRNGGPPTVGVYPIGNYTNAPVYGRVPRDLPGGGQIFESISGQLTITEVSGQRIAGSFTFTAVDGAGASVPVTGSFVSRCDPCN